MAFIDDVLQTPSYGWKDEKGDLIVPTVKQLFSEAFSRINIFKTKKNWISLTSWLMAACMFPFFLVFLFKYISLPLVGAFLLYTFIIMSTQAKYGFIAFPHINHSHLAIRFGGLLHRTWCSALFPKRSMWYHTMCTM